ncbi:hypothetical protein KKI99_09280 [Xenorhabdus bovienii]|nr:hypothetical protein [Xenorhabdus bovienii]
MRRLLELLLPFNIRFFCTDDFSSYKQLPEEKHLVGKPFTQHIERINFEFSYSIKKTQSKNDWLFQVGKNAR